MHSSMQLVSMLRDFRDTHPVKFLQLKTDQWEYVCGGKGDRTVVIVGGAGSTSESMFSINLALESSCRVVSIGLPASISSVDAITQGILAICDSLPVQRAILLGHSLGGMVYLSGFSRAVRRSDQSFRFFRSGVYNCFTERE